MICVRKANSLELDHRKYGLMMTQELPRLDHLKFKIADERLCFKKRAPEYHVPCGNLGNSFIGKGFIMLSITGIL